jgi:putative acetyltransferase
MIAGRCQVREERPEDALLVRRVTEAAFGRGDEADLVEQLRDENAVLASLVADVDSETVGHILFSRMWIESAESRVAAVALAPVAVMPSHQRSGIGGLMIRTGLQLLRDRGEEIVIVLGDPTYYARFGFSRESARPLESPFAAEHFMAMELRPRALTGVAGSVRYPAAFGI